MLRVAVAAVSSSTAPYRFAVAAILLCGASASIWLYHDARRSELNRIATEFERRATIRNTLTRDVLERYEEALYGLSSIFAVDQEVTRNDFKRASQHLLSRLPGVVAFEWVPIVTRGDRDYVEAKMRRMYAPRPFSFGEFDRAGLRRKAADRSILCPICFVEPLAGNESVLGYDISTGPTAKFLEIASGTGRMVATNQFRLRQETAERLGVVMILPVFAAEDRDVQNAGAESQHPIGFLQCIFHVRELLEKASGGVEDTVLDVLVIDDAEDDAVNRRLYYSRAQAAGDALPSEFAFRAAAPLARELTVTVGGRPWRLIYRPRAEWLRTQQTMTPWWRASTLLALSALLAGFVASTGRRTKIIHREVALRTAELAESRRQLSNLLHSLPGMAFRAKYPDGFEVTFASEGALALTGWTPDEFVNGSIDFRRLVHPDDATHTRDRVRNALAERKDLELEFRIRTRSDAEKRVLARARGVYGDDGSCDVIEGILIDITEQKRAEQSRLDIERKLLETQKLESLGLLAGGIAHDFNNLLSAILGNASLARLTTEPGSGIDAQLRAIETASLRAAELCRQMLAYAGKGRFVIERVDLSAMVQELLPLLRVSIARSADLQLDLKRDLPGVKADATQIRQIVMNLVLNAVDAVAGRNGHIVIRTGIVVADRDLLKRCVTGQALPLGPYVMLEVQDNGSGMSEEVRSKIFDPFFTTKFAGRGLGLAAVLGIVRGHNGALMVESAVDAGTTFRLYLPAIVGEVVRIDEPAEEAPLAWTHTGDVLVMEDEEPVRAVMAELLRSFGFRVETAPDGSAGLQAFRADPTKWTLVIVDLLMPGMSGEETLSALQQIRADLRVLLVSGYTDAELTNRKPGPGRVAFLPKPFRREAFEAKLKDLFAP